MKPAFKDAHTDQSKKSSNHLPTHQPIPTDTGRVMQEANGLKRGQDMDLHSTVNSKRAKVDKESEVGEDDLPEVNPPPPRNDKGDTVIVNDNSSDPSVWIDHRDHTAGSKVTLYADSKKLILNPCGWLHDSEVEAAQNLVKMKFPLVDGLEDPAIIGNLVTHATSVFVQIINTGSHWVCISMLSCPAGVVRVYDSRFGTPA